MILFFNRTPFAREWHQMEVSLDAKQRLLLCRLTLRIAYATSPDSTALQCMGPLQTRGGKQPYMFSQCQAIHARSMLPCQDTPAVKASYTARVSDPGRSSGNQLHVHVFQLQRLLSGLNF